MERRKEAYSLPNGKGDVGMGFKLFLSDLAVLLPPETVQHLASCFMFSKTICDRLQTSDQPVHYMIACLQEKDIITSNSISQLIKALESLGESAVRNKIIISFQKWTSMFPEGKPPKKILDKSEPRQVLDAVKLIQEPKIEEKATPESRKVIDAVKRINNSEREQERTPEPRKVFEAAKRINDVEQNARNNFEMGNVMKAVKRIDDAKKIERITTENGTVTKEVNRIVDSAKEEIREKVRRKITESIYPRSASKRIEQDYLRGINISAVDREHFEEFLSHLDLRLENKLTIKEGTCIKLFSNTKEETEHNVSMFFMQLAAQDFLATEQLSTTYTYQQGYSKTIWRISKRDALFSILTCCDLFMLQDVLGKLRNCGRAVPIILPSLTSYKLTFCLWGLRKCMQNIFAREALTTTTVCCCTHPCVTIAALRFGEVKFSKSHILNQLLVVWQQNPDLRCFLSKEEDPEKSIWSEGIVEITWGIRETNKDAHDAQLSFSWLNLRGDGLYHNRQVKFCVKVSNIIIVFLSLRLMGKYIQEINQMAISSRVIVVLDCFEREAINLSSSDKVTFLFCEGLTSQEISDRIKTCLLGLVQSKEGRKIVPTTMEDHSKSCSLLGIDVDEDKFKEAKSMANKIGNTISLSIDQSKIRIFPSQNVSKFTNSATAEINCNETIQKYSKSPLSYTFNTFLKGISLDDHDRQIFLSMLKIILDEKSCSAMSQYLKQYKVHLEEVRNNSIEIPISNQTEKQLSEQGFDMNDLTSLEDRIEQNVINVEHFLFELWRLVQCSHPSLPKYCTIDGYLRCLSSWLLNGNSIDIFKSDPCRSPAAWPRTILNGLKCDVGIEAKIAVVSAFGDISSSKSKLLTHLFGANISQNEIMLPSGIRIQLIPIKNTSEKLLEFEFILLANFENIKLSEIEREGLTERREAICTLLSLITDVLIVSIDNDSTEIEKNAVFNIVVHGMLTNVTCKTPMQYCVVYHVDNDSDIDVKSLEEYTLNKLKDSCSKIENVVKTDDSEDALMESNLHDKVCEKFTLSTQSQDGKLHVKILTSLKNDISLEANQNYIKRIQDLRKYILQMLTDYQHTASTLSEISESISSCFCDTTDCNDVTYETDTVIDDSFSTE